MPRGFPSSWCTTIHRPLLVNGGIRASIKRTAVFSRRHDSPATISFRFPEPQGVSRMPRESHPVASLLNSRLFRGGACRMLSLPVMLLLALALPWPPAAYAQVSFDGDPTLSFFGRTLVYSKIGGFSCPGTDNIDDIAEFTFAESPAAPIERAYIDTAVGTCSMATTESNRIYQVTRGGRCLPVQGHPYRRSFWIEYRPASRKPHDLPARRVDRARYAICALFGWAERKRISAYVFGSAFFHGARV